MALIVNTNIKNDANGYVTDAKFIKGGYIALSGIGDDVKENIPEATLMVGTKVYDANVQKTYRFDGTAWIEILDGSEELMWGTLGS